MMTKHSGFLCALLIVGTVGCGGNDFNSDTGKGGVPKAGVGENGEGDSTAAQPQLGEVTGGKVVVDPLTDKDATHLANCAKLWGDKTPAYSKDAVRKITSSLSVGSSGVMLADLQKTEQPQITIIYSAIAVGGAPEWQLMNPNGFYCIVSSINVGTVLTVTIDKNAHLADSSVAINVGSKADQSVSAVGINVGSTIKVIKK